MASYLLLDWTFKRPEELGVAVMWVSIGFCPSFFLFVLTFNHEIPPFSGQQAKSGGQAGKRHGVSYHYHAASS